MAALTSPVGGAALVAALVAGVIAGVLGHRSLASTATGHETSRGDRSDGDLEDIVEVLETANSPDAVRAAVETLRSAVDRVAADGDIQGLSPGERAKRIERALEAGDLAVTTPDEGADSPGRHTDAHDRRVATGRDGDAGFEAIARAAERVDSPADRDGRRLVSSLESPGAVDSEEFRQTLTAVSDSLDRDAAVGEALAALPRDPGDAGAQLREALRDVDGERADALRQVGSMLSEAARDLDACASERDRLATAAETVCTAAVDAGIDVEGDSPLERVESLADNLDREGSLESGLGDEVGRAVSAADPESVLGRELAAALRTPEGADLRGTLEDVFDALDELQRVRARLDGVRPDEVADLARSVRSSLSGTTAIEETVRERARELESRTSDDRILAFSSRQELNFYDKTLVPRLGAEPDDGHDAGAQIETARERRKEMREQFPRRYDDLNHEIPIHLLDTVSELLDDAETALQSGDTGRALGVARAADTILDATESLYRNNAYHILLRQLRE